MRTQAGQDEDSTLLDDLEVFKLDGPRVFVPETETFAFVLQAKTGTPVQRCYARK